MPSSAQLRTSALRYQIESALAHKAPSALSPGARAVRPVCSTGVGAVDELLEGGLPVGAISEFTGPACSGRVSLAMCFVAGRTREGQVCAWVDASDGFDPASAEASGVTLDRLLWVRCGEDAGGRMEGAAAGSRFAVETAEGPAKLSLGMHPRTEERGLAGAIKGLLGAQKAPQNGGKPGTPGAANRSLVPAARGVPVRLEQIATDRLPARRGEHALEQKSRLAAGESGVVESLADRAAEFARVAPRCAETQQGFARARQSRVAALPVGAVAQEARGGAGLLRAGSRWDRLDQAIRTTDLLLQGGGFGCIVMDLSGMEAECVNRIPLATWFRFRAAADRTRTSLLVLTRHACTGSSGEVLLRMMAAAPEGSTVMTRVPVRVEVARQRFTGGGMARSGNVVTMRKPPRSVTAADWSAPCASLKASGLVR